ncbi:MAG TPA: hypothetical protein VF713_03075, partial [Thermoanaerobaculia bacterium]
MSRHLAQAILALHLALAPRLAFAQTPPPSSGILLGLNLAGDPASYRTFWIAPVDNRVRVVASGPDLIVPGRTGFWRACVVGGYTVEDSALQSSDSVIVYRATAARGACAAGSTEPSDDVRKSARCSGSTSYDILFAGAEAVSSMVFQESICGVHPTGGSALQIQTLHGRALNLEALLGRERREALIRSARRAGRVEFSDYGIFEGVGKPRDYGPSPRLTLEHEWGIERAPGRWQVMA